MEKTEQGALRAVIKVTNKVGHFLPSGVGFRRVFIELLVRDAQGEILWASGRTNKLGAIVEGTTDNVLRSEQPVKFPDETFQPHYQIIDSEGQVQIYQEVIEDSEGKQTTSFLRRVNTLKDNRLRPKGFCPKFFVMNSSMFIQELAEIPGEAQFDPYYSDPDLTGVDMVEYKVILDEEKMAEVVNIYSQSIPPFYLQQRFRDANRGPAIKNNIERLYHLTSHLNVDAQDDNGEKFIDNWKLKIANQCVRIDLGKCVDAQ